ncbi:MAG: hypothetical protein M0025_09205 [Elusimicrobia bacterium]|nr:hypothetical protein [Elusimicrobiota bacterium]
MGLIGNLFYLLSRLITDKSPAGHSDLEVTLERTLHSPDGRLRVCFFRRISDGVCGFREEVYDDKAANPQWRPLREGYIKEYPDMDKALAAARAEVLWLHLVEH